MNPDNTMTKATHENPNLPSAPPSCSVRWVDAHKELPDDEMTVLVALADGEVWTGFHEDNQWRFVSADMMKPRSCTGLSFLNHRTLRVSHSRESRGRNHAR